MSDAEPPPQPAPPPSTPSRERPFWTWFLTPIAVIIGSCIIAAAVYLSRTDDDAATPPADGSVATAPASNQTVQGPSTLLAAFESYVEVLELDGAAFEQCLAGAQERAQVVNAHLQRGRELGVTGTPTFFINNKMVVGAQPPEVFEEIIDRELEGGADSVEEYSSLVRELAANGSFAILDEPVDVSDAVIEGNPDAKVMVAEFSDFQCPFCKQFAATTRRELVAEHGDDLRFVFKHFPIERLHAEAVAAAVAAQCAARLGRFWEAYERFFEDPANLHTDALRAFGEELGLGAGYAECVSEAQTREEVELDIEDGLSIGVQGTPTFVINGRLVVGARPSTIREAVSAALAERAP